MSCPLIKKSTNIQSEAHFSKFCLTVIVREMYALLLYLFKTIQTMTYLWHTHQNAAILFLQRSFFLSSQTRLYIFNSRSRNQNRTTHTSHNLTARPLKEFLSFENEYVFKSNISFKSFGQCPNSLEVVKFHYGLRSLAYVHSLVVLNQPLR